MEDLLINAGLSETQSSVYLYLLKNGESTPVVIASATSLTRSNVYKILDSLIETGLIRRTEVNKKFVYRAEDPVALTGLVATERNRLMALEKSIHEAMHGLRTTYQQHHNDNDVRSYRGKPAVIALYEHQAQTEEPIYFIKTRADVPALGYETMARLRSLPAKNGTERYGITPDAPEANRNPDIDQHTNLTRTLINAKDYTAPVEWTVSGDELLIIDFDKEASGIRIKNASIAKAFKELWHLIDRSVLEQAKRKK